MNEQQADEYSRSLGQIVGGTWRQVKLAQSMGVPAMLGMKLDDWVRLYLGGYARLTVADRRDAVHEMAEEGISQRDIAGVLGVGVGTVNRDISTVPNGTLKDDSPKETVPNGTPKPKVKPAPVTVEAEVVSQGVEPDESIGNITEQVVSAIKGLSIHDQHAGDALHEIRRAWEHKYISMAVSLGWDKEKVTEAASRLPAIEELRPFGEDLQRWANGELTMEQITTIHKVTAEQVLSAWEPYINSDPEPAKPVEAIVAPLTEEQKCRARAGWNKQMERARV